MSDFPRKPAHLEKVRELHGVVRNWIAHIPENEPYVDLMFAFGFATLGDISTSQKLLANARQVLDGLIPPAVKQKDPDPVTVRLVRDFIFQAFAYRIDQVLAGKPHAGPLSGELLENRENITKTADRGPLNNAHKLALYIIDRFRVLSRILEPDQQIDPYASWTKHGDAMKKELAALDAIREPDQLTDRIRKLHNDGIPGKPLKEVQFHMLREGLSLAARVSEAFTVEMLAYVPEAIKGMESLSNSPDLPRRQGELLDRALYFAGRFNRADIVKQLVDNFTTLVHDKPEQTRFKLISVVAGQCLGSLKKLGMTNEIDRLLTTLQAEVLHGASMSELRQKHQSNPEVWSAVHQTLLGFAGGWVHLGMPDRANPILEESRNELISSNSRSLLPNDYTELACAYVAAIGQGPTDLGLVKIVELFKLMPRDRITNTWTTAAYFSRFHLHLVEDTVFAMCQLVGENPWKGKINP